MSAIHEVLSSGKRSIEVRKDVQDEYLGRYLEAIDRLVWAHSAVEHSHFKNRHGKIFTLSPWPMNVYWNWTRSIDVDEYVLT